MISFEPLFHTMVTKKANLTDLTTKAGISTAVVAKFRKNEHVNTGTLEKLCLFLECKIEDVIEILPDQEPDQDQA